MEKVFFRPSRARADAMARELLEGRLAKDCVSFEGEELRRGAFNILHRLEEGICLNSQWVFLSQNEFSMEGSRLKAGGTSISCRVFQRIDPSWTEGAILYACTAGDFQPSGLDPMNQIYADYWGTAYVDAIRTLAKEEMRSSFRAEGLEMSESFGPGFFGMDISEIGSIAEILDFEGIGVRIGRGGLMEPEKSCCGIFLLVNEGYEKPKAECESCMGGSAGCSLCQVTAR